MTAFDYENILIALSHSLSPLPHTAAVIGFALSITPLKERTERDSIFESIPITRSGYLNSSVAVYCRVKGGGTYGNATPNVDFYTTPKPSRVVFGEGDTEKGTYLEGNAHRY